MKSRQMTEMNLRNIYLATFVITVALSPPAGAQESETYALGSGDHVQIHVSDFRAGLGEAYLWPMFSEPNQDFLVGPDGKISVPVAGQVAAVGRTSAEVETDIAARLQQRAGLTNKPDVSVQVVRFRPIYVSGLVDKPGEYDYRPGLSVIQAVSLAGGLQRVTSDLLIGLQKDALSAHGDLKVLEADRLSLIARQARIDAEKADAATLSFPPELSAGDPEAERAKHEEQILFDARRTGLNDQIAALRQNKKNLLGEIDRLRDKNVAMGRGLSATQEEYETIAGLVKKGLSANTRQLELQQNIAQLQGNQLDVEVAIVRANEDIVRADRDIADLNYRYRNELIQEAQDVRVKLNETMQKIDTARQMVRQSEVTAPAQLQSTLDATRSPTYRILRTDATGSHESAAAETDRVRPGDVVRVIFESDSDAAARANAAAAAARN